jgi:HlyD family secretion protein
MLVPRFKAIWLLLLIPLIVVAYAGSRFLLGEKVDVSRVEQGELRQAIVASGRVRTPQRIDISTQITGRVTQVAVREGEVVRPGSLLLQLDSSELKAAVAQARASLNQNEARLKQLSELSQPVAEQAVKQTAANLEQARKQYARAEELIAKGFYSAAQRDEARRALDVAESQWRSAQLQLNSNQPGGSDARVAASNVEQARAALALSEARLSYATLTSPVAGTLLTRSVEAGDTVQAGKVLLTLAPTGDTELTAQIDEKNLALLQLGQKALASADAYPHERFKAEVTYIAPSVDAQRGSVEIRLRVAEPPAYLKQEMTVSIDIEAARRAATLIIPFDSLREASGPQPWVMVVREGETRRQAVRLGVRNGGKIEVLEGLAAGEALLPAKINLPENRRVRAVDR